MIDGRVDVVRRDSISGWCADYDDPNRVIELSVCVDGVSRGRFAASRQRPDLRALRIYGEGNHGFLVELNPPLSSDDDHEIVVRPLGAWGILERGRVRLLKNTIAEQAIVVLEQQVEEQSQDSWGTPRYVLHIGPHKTGSTYLQMAFYESRDALSSGGILYPGTEIGWVGHRGPSHTEFHRRLSDLDTTELPSHFKALNSSDHKTVLISSEDLVGVSRQGLRYLRSLLSGRPVEVVFYCRRWSDLLVSAWQETVKQGQLHAFGDFLAAQLVDPMRSSIMNFDVVLSKYVEVFGLRSIKLMSYNHLVDNGIDLYEHFIASILGWDAPPKVARRTPNRLLGPAEVELIRMLNGVANNRSEPTGVDIFRRYWINRTLRDATSLIDGMAGHLTSAWIDDASPSLRLLHEFLFQKYRDCLVAPCNQYNLFEPKTRDVPFVQDTYLLALGVVDRVYKLYDLISR